MTREHGRHLGLVRGGFGTRMKPILQTGNSVSASWRARLDEHLGNYTLEPTSNRAAQLIEPQVGVIAGDVVRMLPAAIARDR